MRKFVLAGLATVIAVLTGVSNSQSFAGERNDPKSEASTEISWKKDRKLTWNDFRGPVPYDAEDQTAAATFCGIGFETQGIGAKNQNLKVKVYNTFYIGNSWARTEEMNDDVLAHEQGHFDLCELYTRKLRERMTDLRASANTIKPTLRRIYDELQDEYKNRQELYEEETGHGVNIAEQKKWEKMLEKELSDTEKWSES